MLDYTPIALNERERIMARMAADFKEAESGRGFPDDLEAHVKSVFPNIKDIRVIVETYERTIRIRRRKRGLKASR